jgi:hypothetical protein
MDRGVAMDDDDDILDQLLQPRPRSLIDERRRRLHTLCEAMRARHAAVTDLTWACLVHSHEVYDRAYRLLVGVARVEARIHAQPVEVKRVVPAGR